MFDVNCPVCAGRRLIFPGQVFAVENGDDGIVVRFTCWCGTRGAWTTGAATERPSLRWEHAAAHAAA